MYFTGQDGCVRLRRRTTTPYTTEVDSSDVSTTLNRFGFDRSELNIITGDRVELQTSDPRGIAWLPTEAFYANVNADGGIRAFPSYEAALNNDRAQEYGLTGFSGSPIPVTVSVRDTSYEPLAAVVGYTFDTDRATLDATALGDAFQVQLGQGLISGTGTIDCFFDYRRQMSCGPGAEVIGELPVLLLQTIYRFDLGSEFSAILQLAPRTDESEPVYYEVQAVATRTGVVVNRDGLIQCSVNFVSTGPFRLIVGQPTDLDAATAYILKEDEGRIQKEHDLDFLLKEPDM